LIAFDLQCSRGHVFEGWFASNESFEDQKLRGLAECPFCSDRAVQRMIPAVSVKKSIRRAPEKGPDYRKLAIEVMEYIRNNFEDVGTKFTSEALKIHYGASEQRNIRGSATEDEEKILSEEGVQFFKLPLARKEEKPPN